MQSELTQPRRGQRREGRTRRGSVKRTSLDRGTRRAHDPALQRTRQPRLDQLPAKRSQQRLRDGRQTEWAQALEANGRLADQRVLREPTHEAGVMRSTIERAP